MVSKKVEKTVLPLMGTKTQWLSEKPFLVSKAVAVLESLESWNSRSVRKQGARRLAVT